MATWSWTPIWGAASPAPFKERIVSVMSAISPCSSAVSNCPTGCDISRSRGSPIFNTGLIAIEQHQLFQYVAHAHRGAFGDGGDIAQPDFSGTRAAPGGVVDDDGDRPVAQPELAGERRFRHAGHAHHV